MDNIKKIQGNKSRATAVYYTLLNLHMFSDRNGRTSRFMYNLISEELDENNISYYFHKDSNLVTEQKNQLKKEKGILDISIVNRIPDTILSKQLDFIPDGMLEKYPWITVGYSNDRPSTDKILPSIVLSELSKQEIQNLDLILTDGYGVNLCTSGLAMLYVIQKKGQLNEWLKYNSEDENQGIAVPGRFNISIYKHPERISDWNSDDFREVINIGNDIKYARLKCLIDIFVFPEKFINPETGNTYANDILNVPLEKESEEQMTR